MVNAVVWLSVGVLIVALIITIAQAFWLNSARDRMKKIDVRLEELSQLVHTMRRLNYLREETHKSPEYAVPQDGLGRVSASPVASSADGLSLERIRARQNLAQVPSEATTRI